MERMVFCLRYPSFWLESERLPVPDDWFGGSFGVPCALYIDDRHVSQLRLPLRALPRSFSAFQLAEMAAYIACFSSISLGYFIALSKSSLLPATALTFLGYVYATRLGRLSFCHLISVPSFLL